MIEIKNEGVCFPYGNLVTKFLEDTKFNFKDEEYKEEITKIGKISYTNYKIRDHQ